MSENEITDLLSKTYGSESESEQISLVLIEFNEDNIIKTRDAKLICAGYLYEKN